MLNTNLSVLWRRRLLLGVDRRKVDKATPISAAIAKVGKLSTVARGLPEIYIIGTRPDRVSCLGVGRVGVGRRYRLPQRRSVRLAQFPLCAPFPKRKVKMMHTAASTRESNQLPSPDCHAGENTVSDCIKVLIGNSTPY